LGLGGFTYGRLDTMTVTSFAVSRFSAARSLLRYWSTPASWPATAYMWVGPGTRNRGGPVGGGENKDLTQRSTISQPPVLRMTTSGSKLSISGCHCFFGLQGLL
jgi:hypothetical protein